MPIPTWSDLVEDKFLYPDDLISSTAVGDETYAEFDSYGYIGKLVNNKWWIHLPGYDASYPYKDKLYVRDNQSGSLSLYEYSDNIDFTSGYPVGYYSSSHFCEIMKNRGADSSENPYVLEYGTGSGDPVTVLTHGSKLYMRNLDIGFGEPTLYWVEYVEGEPVATQIEHTPTPPPPPSSNFEPVSYIKGNMTFTSLSMIKKSYTNEGEAINVGSNLNPFERLINPTLEALGNQLALNTERNFAYSDDDNYVSITKTDTAGDDTTYVLKYYIDGVEDSSLRQTYVCTTGEQHYFSFIFDRANEAARPSVIREYPVLNEVFHEYNQETVTSSMLAKYYEWLGNSRQSEIPDPYNQGSEATSTDNPSGTFDRTNDPVNFPTAPSTNLLATGFFRAYLASKTDLASLATYLWGAGFDLDTLKKIFASPIDSILHCLGIPLALTSTELLRDVYLGNVNSNVQMKPVSSQVVVVDCGSIDLDEFYGSYLDYAPYTRLSLYLPYIGVVNISVDDVMGKEVSVKYYVDVLTGACLALVKADDNVLYHYTGACGIDVPLTASDYTSVISGLWGAVTTVASGIATAVTGGAAAPLLVGSVAQTANNVMASKPQTQRSGGFTAITGLMDVQYPHIILEIPEQCHVNDQNRFKGYPIHKDYTLSDLTGYTEIEAIHLENMTCTDTELQEIETLLEGGVIL